MSEYRVAARYAKALFQLSEEAGQTDTVRQELAAIRSLIRQSADFATFLGYVGLTATEQREVMAALGQGRVSELVNRMVEFLIERRRLPVLGALCDAFEDLYRESRGILPAHVTSAFPLRPDQLTALRGKLEAKYRKQMDVTVETDPALLGGFVVVVKDNVHDFSVKGRLTALRAELARV